MNLKLLCIMLKNYQEINLIKSVVSRIQNVKD